MHKQPVPWKNRSFLKDAKLRVQERYWRESRSGDVPVDWNKNFYTLRQFHILPDAVTVRKYLAVIEKLVCDDICDIPVQWHILESVVEYMDYRNQSPVLADRTRREAATPHERKTLQSLLLQNKPDADEKNRKSTTSAFCDLSIRVTDDEWDMMEYESIKIPERSRHALFRAARIITTDSSRKGVICVIVCDDEDCKCTDDGVWVMRMTELIDLFVNEKILSVQESLRIAELCRVCEKAYQRRNTSPDTTSFGGTETNTEYLNEESIAQGLRDGRLQRGRLVVTKENTKEAYVVVKNKNFFIDLKEGHHKRAFHQDTVVIEILPQQDWGRPIGRRRLSHHSDADEETADSFADLAFPQYPSAKVVSIEIFARRSFVGTLIETPLNNESTILIVPMDMRIPKIRVRTRCWKRYVNMRLLVQIDDWEVGSQYPAGHCSKIIGEVGEIETEVASLLHECEIELEPFGSAALACLPPEADNWTIPEAEVSKRKDFREIRCVFSVDPPGCQDIDDAMHAHRLPNGDIEIGVHIADVCHFVPHRSPLDREAQERSTTFYLVDRRFDMLPSLLSSNLCSLHGGTDRLAVSVIWTMSEDLTEVKTSWFGRTVIHSCAAMTYKQADNLLSGQPADNEENVSPPPMTAGAPVDLNVSARLKEGLEILTALARKLRKDREDIGGAVDLSNGDQGSELQFSLKSGIPTEVIAKEDTEVHHTIAELMILANTTVATQIYSFFPDSALLRIHRSVPEDYFDDFRELLQSAGIAFCGPDNAALALSLKKAEEVASPFVRSLLRSLATRAMSEAQYVCAGAKTRAELSHYGLGLSLYTHFTSPIRRYADIVVHRQLLATLKSSKQLDLDEQKRYFRQIAPLPVSNFLSVLKNGYVDNQPPPLSEKLIESFRAFQSTSESVSQDNFGMNDDAQSYSGSELVTICEKLNVGSRRAKYASMECQSLFLSLFLRNRVVVERAIVAGLRTNGIVCYVPRFGFRSPIYFQDRSGSVQIDPAFLDLVSDHGQPPTVGFSNSSTIRRIPNASVVVHNSKDDSPTVKYLEVSTTDSLGSLILRELDEVKVELSCWQWDSRARVPSPQLQLSYRGEVPHCKSDKKHKSRTNLLDRNINRKLEEDSEKARASIYSLCETTMKNVEPLLHRIPFRYSTEHPKVQKLTESLKGRLVLRNFVNPDTRSSLQEALQQSAATQGALRRVEASDLNDCDSLCRRMNQIEKTVIVRQQKLAAEKRSSRRAKAV